MEVILLVIRYLQKNIIVIRAIISDWEGALSKLDSAISSLGIHQTLCLFLWYVLSLTALTWSQRGEPIVCTLQVRI